MGNMNFSNLSAGIRPGVFQKAAETKDTSLRFGLLFFCYFNLERG
jgi:hypothetical protein